MTLHKIAVAFHKQQVGEAYSLSTSIGFQENRICGFWCEGERSGNRTGRNQSAVLQPVDGFNKPFETNGFQQIVHHTEVKGIEGMSSVGGAEHHGRRLGQGAQQFQAGELGHVYIEKQHIDRRGAQHGQGFHGSVAAAGPGGQARQAVEVSAQHGVGQGLIINQ